MLVMLPTTYPARTTPHVHTFITDQSKAKMRTSFSLSVLLLLAGGAAAQIKDTIKNRIKIAEQFLAENPVQDNVEAVARCVLMTKRACVCLGVVGGRWAGVGTHPALEPLRAYACDR